MSDTDLVREQLKLAGCPATDKTTVYEAMNQRDALARRCRDQAEGWQAASIAANKCHDRLVKSERKNATLRERLEAAEQDTARLDWWCRYSLDHCVGVKSEVIVLDDVDIRASIDEAREQE